jgi:hypothetical protein
LQEKDLDIKAAKVGAKMIVLLDVPSMGLQRRNLTWQAKLKKAQDRLAGLQKKEAKLTPGKAKKEEVTLTSKHAGEFVLSLLEPMISVVPSSDMIRCYAIWQRTCVRPGSDPQRGSPWTG